jgi:hypothetical protein
LSPLLLILICSKDCVFEGLPDGQADFTKIAEFFPEEKNLPQTFVFPEEQKQSPWKRLKILFNDSTDFYGRIIIYDLDVLGTK